MTKSLFGVFLLLMVLFSRSLMANAQRPSPKIGDTAPPLTLNKTLQANETAALDLNTLKGNVVVLEFWATWCLPCIPAIKRFNQLSEKDRKSTRLNSSHSQISYAVFCLKKKKKKK